MLRRWDNLHEAMLDQPVASAAVLDPDLAIVRANRMFAGGVGSTVEGCAGRALSELVAEGALLEGVGEAVRTLRPATVSVRTACGSRAGSGPRDMEWSIAPVLDEAGGLAALFLSGVDVTAARRTEEALRISENIYESVFNCMSEGAVFQASNGRIVAANPAAERLLGVQAETLLTRDSRTPEWDALRDDETPFPPDEHPAMVTLRTRRAVTDVTMGLRRPGGDRVWVSINSQPVKPSDGESTWAVVTTFHDITERRAAAQRQALMIHELNHRVKNTLALVQAIAAETAKTAQTLEAFTEAFNTRLLALSHTHDVLTRTDWTGAQLRELVVEQLSPFGLGEGGRFDVAGPPVMLAPKAAIALGVVLGELATNAMKYGALSAESGSVSLRWTREAAPGEPRLRILWREAGGPAVNAPGRRGLGMRLIERGLPHELGGAARLSFEPQGLSCEIELPLEGNEK